MSLQKFLVVFVFVVFFFANAVPFWTTIKSASQLVVEKKAPAVFVKRNLVEGVQVESEPAWCCCQHRRVR